MIPVSVVIVTKNESARIVACLSAVSAAFGEVIVFDSASTDDTAAIARAHGARVENFLWDGRYPKKRQYALDHLDLRHDWVFFVDADEIITPALAAEIAALDFSAAGYFVRGRYIWAGRALNHGLKNNKLVLFNRHQMTFPVIADLDLPMGEIEGHYQPILKPQHAAAAIGQLQAEMDHHAASTYDEWLVRHHRYAAWERGMNTRNAWPVDPLRWRQVLKKLFRALPCRGTIAFLHSYILKRGFLDGRAGYDFARSRMTYYRMI